MPAKRRNGLLRRVFFGRATMARTAVLLAAVFGAFHLLGWRDDTAILSGTFGPHDARLTAIRGVLYAMFYFATVVLSPILVIAAGLSTLMRRFGNRSSDQVPRC